ncbi:MAG: hypothetical protein GX144_00025 [Clostridiaceae bacterium]|nr:hypothetical protein [Clostridiaceae bacterium]
MKKFSCFLFSIFLMLFGLLLLNLPVPVGLADNTDFQRVTQPMGLEAEKSLRYFYFQSRYNYVRTFDSWVDHVRFILSPSLSGSFKSTQIIPLKVAQLINAFVAGTDSGRVYFDIRVCGVLFMALHSISVCLIWDSLPVKTWRSRSVLLLFFILIYYDLGYLLYYHSFYGEAVTLAGFLLWLVILLRLVNRKEKSCLMLIAFYLSSVLFIGAKVANIPLGVFIAVFSLIFLLEFISIRPSAQSIAKCAIVITGICAIIIVSNYYYQAVPSWMKKIDNYHSIFFGVLKNSKDPEKDLLHLNIDPKYAVLADTNGYSDLKGFDIYSETFQREVYDRAGPFQVGLFYIKNPGRLVEKLKTSAEASLMIRPTYLGNYLSEDSTEIVKFCRRFSAWETIRKQFNGIAFPVVTGILFLDGIFIFYQFKKMKKPRFRQSSFKFLCLKVTLILFTLIQWIFPVIGNGEADLAKHMFLFNLLLDTVFLIMIADIFLLLEQKQLKVKPVLILTGVLLLTVVIGANPEWFRKDRSIVFGRMNGKELVWEVLDETETHLFLVSKQIVAKRSFSTDSSNLWEFSEIRQWLNSETAGGFLQEFSEDELKRILTIPRKTLIPPDVKDSREFGHQAHFWVSVPGYATQNYNDAYGILRNEKVFLLSVKEWEAFGLFRNKGAEYWLRTPYAQGRTVRIVGEDGYVYHKEADYDQIGVLPALVLKK